MNDDLSIHYRAEGEANFYALLQGRGWLARVHINGELSTPQQNAIMEMITSAIDANPAMVEVVSQGTPAVTPGRPS